jgi:enoyl-CoA hydratase/carnithine racemase
MSRALDLMMSSRTFTAEEAYELGIVNHVAPKEEVLDAAVVYASDLAQNCSPTSMAVMKQQLYSHALLDVDSALAESNKLMRESLTRSDFKEGVKSYVEKRAPSFDPLGR